jgi:glycosyltransferase involved in cell wall biosynthesis
VNPRLVIVVRADPVICGHAGEARNLAEVAVRRGFDDVRIVTWPMATLQASGLPLKPLDSVLPYSPGITVERPEGVGDYRVPDGRFVEGITGRLVELFTDGVPTVAMSLYLTPHTTAVIAAVTAARSSSMPTDVTTVAEAVGSDITNVVRSCVDTGRFGAAVRLLSAYLANDRCVAVSEFTRRLIVDSAAELDRAHGTAFATACADRIDVSYPAIDSHAYTYRDPGDTAAALARRGLRPGGYALFLSRLTKAKGVDDLIDAYARSRARHDVDLVIAGNGPEAVSLRAQAATSGAGDRITFLDDVPDAEKPHLMAGCAAFVLPSKPRPEFIETFGIALAEKMLAGGGPVVTCATGGILEAVGDTALVVPPGAPGALREALDFAVGGMTPAERARREAAGRVYAMQFDRERVFSDLFDSLEPNVAAA